MLRHHVDAARCFTFRLLKSVGFPIHAIILAFAVAVTPPLDMSASYAGNARRKKAASEIRYAPENGQAFAYSVTVEVETGDATTTYKGTPTYTVKSVSDDQIVFAFQGSLNESVRRKPRESTGFPRPFPIMPPHFPSPFSPLTGVSGASKGRESEIILNPRGEIIRLSGSSQLPYLLGNLSTLMLEALPTKKNASSWTKSNDIAITKSDSRFPFPSFMPQRGKTETRAEYKAKYTITERETTLISFKKKSELVAAVLVNGKPRIEMQGSGTGTFDLKRGMPASLEFNETLTVREGNVTTETPIRITYKLLSQEEHEKLVQAQKEAAAAAVAAPKGSEREKILDDLASGDQSRFLKRLLELQRKKPDKPDNELAAALTVFLKHEQSSTRFAAARALENWATEKTVPALLKALDDESSIVRNSVMKTLARLKAPGAAKPIAQKLVTVQDRFQASAALKTLGSVAETDVAKLASHQDWQVRLEVCRILSDIGTKKSLSTLKKLEQDDNALIQQTARSVVSRLEDKN